MLGSAGLGSAGLRSQRCRVSIRPYSPVSSKQRGKHTRIMRAHTREIWVWLTCMCTALLAANAFTRYGDQDAGRWF